MDLGDFLRLLFYLWFAVSLTVYGVRIYRRVTKRGKADPVPTFDEQGNLVAEPDADGSAEPAAGSIDRAKKPALPSLTRAERKRAAQNTEDVPAGSLVQAAIREELAKKHAADAVTGRDGAGASETTGEAGDARRTGDSGSTGAAGDSGDSGGSSDSSDSGRDAEAGSGRTGLFAARDQSSDRSTVAAALQGIAMPCDLVPLLEGDNLDPYRVSFVTTDVAPSSVATEVADELERLGFAIRTIAASSARATRGATTVDLEVVEDAAGARVEGQRRFPHVAPGSVVVVFST